VDVDPELMTGREACEGLAERGVLAKETHGSTLRLAPPLVIEPEELDWMVDQLEAVLAHAPGSGIP
jgi:ornithine--oxo-acid transaminase